MDPNVLLIMEIVYWVTNIGISLAGTVSVWIWFTGPW